MTDIPDEFLAKGRELANAAHERYRDSFEIIARALMAERKKALEEAESAVARVAVEQGRQECCGCGVGSPPECCADPLYMISSEDAAAAIRKLGEG